MSNYIVTLCHNHWELTDNLLKDLLWYEWQNVDKLIIVDNASGDPQVEEGFNRWEKSELFPLKIERLSWNSGFTLGANIGINLALGGLAEKRIVFLISNDVRIHGKFIQQTEEILYGAKRALVGNKHVFDGGWNKIDSRIFDYLDGSFLAATSDGWRDIGLFDPIYAPGDFEDVDLSTTAKKKGYKLVALNNPNIVHLGAGTTGYNSEREARTRRNQEFFRRKWMPE